MDPRFGLVGPGRLLERAPPTSTDSLVRLRPGDWWLGSLVSYKGELIEEGLHYLSVAILSFFLLELSLLMYRLRIMY